MSENFDEKADVLYSNVFYSNSTSSPIQTDDNKNEYFDDIGDGDDHDRYVEDDTSPMLNMGAEKRGTNAAANTGLQQVRSSKNKATSHTDYVRRDTNLDIFKASPPPPPPPPSHIGSNNMIRYASEEIKMLKEHSHFLYSKVVSLENKLQESQARIRLHEEEIQTVRDISDRTKRNNEDLQRQLTQVCMCELKNSKGTSSNIHIFHVHNAEGKPGARGETKNYPREGKIECKD